MVMADAVIHFRFKNETTLDKFAFSGSSVSVKELKNHISTKHKLDQVSSRPDKRQAPSELSLQNDATGEVYANDDTEIPKDTTVLVARRLLGGENGDKVAEEAAVKEPTSVAAELPAKKVMERTNSEQTLDHHYSGHGYREVAQGLQDPEFVELGFPTLITTTTDISELDLPEDQKILAMMYQCLLFYDHTAYVSRARNSQSANPPPSYICKNCGGTGHWPNRCPNASESNYHMPPRRNNQMRAPVMKPTTENTNPAPYATIPVDTGPEYEDIPQDLRCNLCQHVIRNAVKLPCCEKSYCDDCVQTRSLSDDNNCPNCGVEFKYDECLPNQLLRDSVEKWERDVQIKKQKRRDEVSRPNVGHMKEPSTPPAIPAGPGRNVVRPTKTVTRPDHHQYGHHNQQRPQQQHHPQDRTPPSNEPQQIGSLTRATPSVNVNLFQAPHIPSPRDRNVGGNFQQNSGMFMGNNARPRQPAANPAQMGFYAANQYGDASGAAFGPAAYAMGGAWRGAMPYGGVMPGMPGMRYPGVAFGMGHPAAVRAMYGQQLPAIPAQAMVPGQQQQPLPNLRITRIPNTPKVPIQAPHNDDPPRRSPEKSSRSDDKDYRDKDRRDKDDDRRRDDRSSKYDKYDDRDRRRSSRSPERRRSRDYSPDRRDRKRETSSRSDDKKDSRLSDRDRRKRDENLSPSSKGKSDRDKDRSDRTERKIETIGTVKREKEPEKIPEVAVAEKAVPDAKNMKEEENTIDVKPVPEVKAEPSQQPGPSLDSTSVDSKEKLTVAEASKPFDEPLNLPAKESLPSVNDPASSQVTNDPLDSPPKEKEREDTDKTSEASSSHRKDDGSRSKKSRSSRRDKDKDRKKEKRARSESADQKSLKKRSSRKNSNEKEEGEAELLSQENAEKSRTSSRAEEEKSASDKAGDKEERSEKRSGKSSRSSRKDKDRSSKERKPSDRDEEREEKGANWKTDWKSREKRPRSETPKPDKRDVKRRSDDASSSQKPSDRDKDKDRKSHRSKKDDDAKDKDKSSHKSRSSKKDKDKSSKSGKEKEDVAGTSKIVDARSVGEGIRQGKESNGGEKDKERSSRKRDASVESREAGEVVEGKHKSSRSHKSKSKKDKSSKASKSEKHSKREASPTDKKKHRKKHRKEKKGEGSRSSVTEENAAVGS
ncbi:hypothetical protein RvY_15517 [Ramazzottius varieornatus]|uniref:E3 ubiquitin-protein ligase RBBP6 n=1 Tax=Ramazzottius varieornatus TaxID=947166 RepID=A0A1D1VV82_RAMVA|nr:hypothetical protein RvY_15517 [Ramazzottius varieornatus]